MAKYDRIPDWSGQRVAVLGYGIEGQSSARFLLDRGARVIIHDDREASFFADEIEAFGATVDWQLGTQAFTDLSQYDWLLRSPGVPLTHTGLSAIDPSRLTSQTEIFLTHCRDQCVGVTGSKGKGTTATLIAHLLQAAGRTVVVGGNIGRPLFDVWDEMTEQTVAVLELSSFQLQDIRVSPAMAVILMVVPEHLNYHGSVTAYTAAKRQLLRWQVAKDRAIINVDYPLSAEMAERTSGQVWRVSHTKTMGAWINGSEVWLCVEQPEVLTTLEQLSVRGQHNLENVAAAGLAAYLLGVPLDVMRQALPAYRPLPHHLALIHQWSRICFYDDSFATTPEAAAAAVASFDQPLSIIIGGSDKGSDYKPLLKALKRYPDLKGVVTVGEVGPAMADQLRQAGIQVPISQGITDMSTMVKVAVDQLGKQGGIVLLSPAAASFGLFKDYKDRGDQFIAAARQYE